MNENDPRSSLPPTLRKALRKGRRSAYGQLISPTELRAFACGVPLVMPKATFIPIALYS